MNSRVQGKLNEIRTLSAKNKKSCKTPSRTQLTIVDGLSMAISSKKDADTFMTELKAIKKRIKS